MTAETAKEVISEAIKDGAFRSERLRDDALTMAVRALELWETSLDIDFDYKQQAKQLGDMIKFYRVDARPVKQDGEWCCPECGKRIGEWHSYCHNCGRKIGWNTLIQRKPGKGGNKKPKKGKK